MNRYAHDKNLILSEGSTRAPAIGHRIGAIVAAAIENSRSLRDIIAAAHNVVAVSFRVGTAAERKSTSILGNNDAPSPQWAYLQVDRSEGETRDMLRSCETEVIWHVPR